jgi:hypothetical protein
MRKEKQGEAEVESEVGKELKWASFPKVYQWRPSHLILILMALLP